MPRHGSGCRPLRESREPVSTTGLIARSPISIMAEYDEGATGSWTRGLRIRKTIANGASTDFSI